jgi:hypothetical protein
VRVLTVTASRICRYVSLVIVLIGLVYAGRARANVLTVDFDTFGEKDPSVLCVVSRYARESVKPDKIEERLLTAMGTTEDMLWCPLQMGAPSALEELDKGLPPEHHIECTSLPGANGTEPPRGVVIEMSNVSISSVRLSKQTARIDFRPDNRAQGTADVRVLGGSYHSSAALPSVVDGVTQTVRLPLVPLCVRRTLVIPEHRCVGASDGYRMTERGGGKPSLLILEQSRTARVVLKNRPNGSSVSVTHCGNTFSESWQTPVPGHHIPLAVTRFPLRWTADCASEYACPDPPKMSGVGVVCHFANELQKVPVGGSCDYVCDGLARFPATVELSRLQGTARQSWTTSVSFPGYVIPGYIPPDQRRLELDWKWDHAECAGKTGKELQTCVAASRKSRGGRVADRIDYVEIRSPEGHLYRAGYNTAHVRMPDLDCEDYVTYRYEGARTFDEHHYRTKGFRAELEDPRTQRNDRFGIGVAVGGGTRAIAGVGWGLQGEAQAIFIFRHLRDLPGARVWQHLDIEARVGAVLSNQPYCAHFSSSPSLTCSGDGTSQDFERVGYWRVPITVGPTYQLLDELRFGIGAGVAFTANSWATDSDKVFLPPLAALHSHLSYRLSPAFSAELYGRVFGGEKVKQTVFDSTGVVTNGAYADASATSVFWGVMLRADDFL